MTSSKASIYFKKPKTLLTNDQVKIGSFVLIKPDKMTVVMMAVLPYNLMRVALTIYRNFGFGKGVVAEAIANFAVAYADQTERDYQALVDGVKSDRIAAETDI